MPHDTTLIATIAVGLGLALAGGFVAVRLGLSPIVGYLLAGVAVGPHTPGFVADARLASQLAEIGVILLMFGVGMHFSVRDLWAVRAVAAPGALAQIAAATALGVGLSALWGWSLAAGLVFGLALSVASTVVLLRALEANGMLATADGRIAIGWLIVEDLFMVLALVLLPALASALGGGGTPAGEGLARELALTLAKVGAFVALMLIAGSRLFPWMLREVDRTGSRELFTLAAVALALGVAYGSAKLFGVSFALGAFFAGVVIHASDVSHRAERDLRPLQDAFAVLFFVAVGMLFDPRIVIERPLAVAATVGVIVLGKSAAAALIVLALGRTRATALFVSAALAQIGEFSFILAGLGIALGVLPSEAMGLIVAGALLSILINPLAFRAATALGAARAA